MVTIRTQLKAALMHILDNVFGFDDAWFTM